MTTIQVKIESSAAGTCYTICNSQNRLADWAGKFGTSERSATFITPIDAQLFCKAHGLEVVSEFKPVLEYAEYFMYGPPGHLVVVRKEDLNQLPITLKKTGPMR